MAFPELFNALKSIEQFPGWSEPELETGYCWFDAPLTIAGVTQQAFIIHGGYLKMVPEANVTFELLAKQPGKRRKVPLARVDWRAVRGGHVNPRKSDSPVSGKRCSPTHVHAFDLNWLESEQRMRRGNLPMANDVQKELQSFEELLSYVGNLFRINNISVVLPPKWEYDLFS